MIREREGIQTKIRITRGGYVTLMSGKGNKKRRRRRREKGYCIKAALDNDTRRLESAEAGGGTQERERSEKMVSKG